jgi:hypothetical protein
MTLEGGGRRAGRHAEGRVEGDGGGGRRRAAPGGRAAACVARRSGVQWELAPVGGPRAVAGAPAEGARESRGADARPGACGAARRDASPYERGRGALQESDVQHAQRGLRARAAVANALVSRGPDTG